MAEGANSSQTNQSQSDGPDEGLVGLLYGLAAFGTWGFVAIYFKTVGHVAPLEVLAHRILWSIPLLFLLVLLRGTLGSAREALRSSRVRWTLLASTVLISLNWFLFIWAVDSDRILQASLGYYINPLVNVLLGTLVLGEVLRPWQRAAVGMAFVGVVAMALIGGVFPWLSLLLAVSFGTYGLLRKTVAIGALGGLMVETVLIGPICIAFLLWRAQSGDLDFLHMDRRTDLLLLAGGAITAIPLLWFNEAARRLRFTTLGFLQYLAPTLQFLVAVLLYGELFTRAHAIGFGFIWLALAIYSTDRIRAARA